MTKIKQEMKKLFENTDKKAFFTILFMTFAITLYFYFGIQDFFEKVFGKYFSSETELTYYKYIYHNFMALFFFFILSLPLVKIGFKQKLSELGLNLQNKKTSLIFIGIAVVIVPLMALSSIVDPEMVQMYPLGGEMVTKNALFFLLYYISYLAYYFGWEYLFRGLAFFNISNKYGFALAIIITTMISAIIHSSIAGFGKPFTETFSAIFGGLIFGFIAYKTKSIFPTLFFHFMLGFSLDMFIIFLT